MCRCRHGRVEKKRQKQKKSATIRILQLLLWSSCHLKAFRFSDMTWWARTSKETEIRKRHQSAKLSPQSTGRTGIRRLTEWQYFQSPRSSLSSFSNEKWEDARSFCTSQRATLRLSQVLAEKPFVQMHRVNSVCRNSKRRISHLDYHFTWSSCYDLTIELPKRCFSYCFVNFLFETASWNFKNLERSSKRAILRSRPFGFSVSDSGYHVSVFH